MKREIEVAIQNFESNNDNEPKPNQNNPFHDNKVGMSKELKILFWVGGIIFGLTVNLFNLPKAI